MKNKSSLYLLISIELILLLAMIYFFSVKFFEIKFSNFPTKLSIHDLLADLSPAFLPLALPTEKSIEIDISSQWLKTRQDGKMLGEYQISSGKRSTPTRIGNFKVLEKLPIAYGCGADGQCWKMPYWIGIYLSGNQENGIHELPFINGRREGAKSLGWPVSHGCVRLGIGPAELVYHWAEVGIPVNVHP